MNAWFRFYNQAMRDPKVMRLTDSDFRLWVSLLSVASENDGLIPCLDDLKLLLNRRLDHLSAGIDRLAKAVLIDPLDDGFAPHNWSKYQYHSDKSTERVKRFRNRQRNDDETPPEPDTDTDTEQSPLSPPQTGGLAGRPCPESLALDLCKRAGIRNPGPAATEHVRRWLADGIPETTMRNVVTQMATGSPAATRSLKRFDLPIRREHAERRETGLNGGARRYEPKTPSEIERAIRFAEDHGDMARAAELRSKLDTLNLMQVEGRA